MKYELGTMVAFYWRATGQWLVGKVIDHISFNDKIRHGVEVDGRVYDVWPDMAIGPAYVAGM
jgi:hypothetical protein